MIRWEAYKELSDKAGEKIENVIKDDTLGIDEVFGKIESTDREIKFASFGKSRMSTNKKKANKTEEMKNEDILRKQCKQIEDKINEVKDKKLGRVRSIFKMKECILGGGV